MARASAELIADYAVDVAGDDLPQPSWNIAPTTRIPVILDAAPRASDDTATTAEPTRRLEGARWGLVPPWAKDVSVGVRAFNARSETAASKPTFRAAVASRRAVVPASGYYEWHTGPDGKQPYYIHLGEGDLLMAGLYEWWRDPNVPDASWLLSATILTQDATGDLAEIHPRMPVFLDRDRLDAWIDPAVRGDDGLVRDFAQHGVEVAARVQHHAVDRAVGNVRNNGPELIEQVEE